MEVSDNWVYLFVLKQITAVILLDFFVEYKFLYRRELENWAIS